MTRFQPRAPARSTWSTPGPTSIAIPTVPPLSPLTAEALVSPYFASLDVSLPPSLTPPSTRRHPRARSPSLAGSSGPTWHRGSRQNPSLHFGSSYMILAQDGTLYVPVPAQYGQNIPPPGPLMWPTTSTAALSTTSAVVHASLHTATPNLHSPQPSWETWEVQPAAWPSGQDQQYSHRQYPLPLDPSPPSFTLPPVAASSLSSKPTPSSATATDSGDLGRDTDIELESQYEEMAKYLHSPASAYADITHGQLVGEQATPSRCSAERQVAGRTRLSAADANAARDQTMAGQAFDVPQQLSVSLESCPHAEALNTLAPRSQG